MRVRTAVSAQRAARNEALFRSINEEIRAASEVAYSGGDVVHDFVCECASETCTTPLRLTLREYDEVREHRRRFVVAPGHDEPGLERVVREGATATVVEKYGHAGDVAEETAPRSG
jgi:hypothetical protein